MGKSQEHKYGGFCAENAGTIENCYARTNVKGHIQTAGFVASNKGEVNQCYSAAKVKSSKQSGGFYAENQGQIANCYFDKGAVQGEKLLDDALGLEPENLSKEGFFKEHGWDFEDIWKMSEEGQPPFPQLQTKAEFLDKGQDEQWIRLAAKEQLLEAADKIRQGNLQACKASYLLEADLDLGGMKWPPLGNYRNPFEGKFDGGGHCIRNFTVVGKKEEVAGFFGCVQNAEVKNLGVDCIVKGGEISGALVGMNNHGTIESCYAISKVSGKSNAGGLAGRNTGTIRQCFAAGEVSGTCFYLPLFGSGLLISKAMFVGLGILVLLIGGITAALLMRTKPVVQDIVTYPPVEVDSDANEDPADNKTPSNTGNSVSFEFDKTIEVSADTGEAKFHFKNPGDSNHNIVVQLQMTDQELTKKLGTTGRTKEEQTQLEAQEGYDPATSRVILAESGAIPPRYSLEHLKVDSLPNGEKLTKGNYNAVIYLLFYDMKTNERALVNTQMPVKLVVK